MVKKMEDMISRSDTIHDVTDRQTNGRTPHDSKGCAYAQHRAEKFC